MIRGLATCLTALSLVAACTESPPPAPRQLLVSVPNVVGTSLGQAESQLKSAGLDAANDLEEPCPGCPPQQAERANQFPLTQLVQDQQPTAGIRVKQGTIVHLHACCLTVP